jgi:hypothetical protein
MNEQMNEWVNEWVSEWVIDWVIQINRLNNSQLVNQIKQQHTKTTLNTQMSERRTSEW